MASQLNKFNFLRWTGEFNSVTIDNEAVDDVAAGAGSANSIVIDALINDTSTIGIDLTSIEITLQVNPTKPAVWDSLSNKIIFYPNNNPAGDYILKYRWKDTLGNYSNEASVTITLSDAGFGWRGYQSSYYCVLGEDDEKTGYATFAQLVKYVIATNANVSPLVLKPNTEDDPDYIPPVLDTELCASSGTLTLNAYFAIQGQGALGPSKACSYYANHLNARTIYMESGGDDAVLIKLGDRFFSNDDLTIPVVDGFYAIYGKAYSVSGGVVYAIMSCS